MSTMIKLNDALKQMETGKPFSMTFVTLDVKRGTGGKLSEVDECILVQKKAAATAPMRKPKRNPEHWTNQTRGFKRLVAGYPTSSVRKFHIFLITKFNGQTVYL